VCLYKYFYLHDVDYFSFEMFKKSLLLTSQVLHFQNQYKISLQIVRITSRYIYCTTILFVFRSAFLLNAIHCSGLNTYRKSLYPSVIFVVCCFFMCIFFFSFFHNVDNFSVRKYFITGIFYPIY